MFGRKPPDTPEPSRPAGFSGAVSQPTASRPVAPAAPRPLDGETGATIARPAPVAAQPIRRPAEPIRQETPREVHKLIVGRGIAFSGEISACDDLIVEGTVEARLPGGHRIEITETGLFQGAVEIDEADIGGRFVGEITVKNRLTVRATGRIEGKVQYGELAVEAGGVLQGEISGIAKKVEPVTATIAGIRAPVELVEDEPEPSAAFETGTDEATPDAAEI